MQWDSEGQELYGTATGSYPHDVDGFVQYWLKCRFFRRQCQKYGHPVAVVFWILVRVRQRPLKPVAEGPGVGEPQLTWVIVVVVVRL